MIQSPDVSPDDHQASTDVLIVDASQPAEWLDWRELWRYRNLIWIFAIRDIKVKYRQTLIGITWTVLQPLAYMFAFGVLKMMLVKEGADRQMPDGVLMFCGLLQYQLFAAILGASTLCLVDNRQMVTKVYFPRAALPLSACLRPLLDFSIGLVVLALLMIWFQVPPSPRIVFAPIVILLTVGVGLGFGLWLSSLNAHYRDFGYIVPFMLNLGLIISPAAYESSQVPDSWRWLYFVNPMASLLDGFRWSVLGTNLPGGDEILISLAVATFLFVSGAWYFHRVDRFLADSI